MNKTDIKNFAIWARNKLIADICYRAGLMGITEKGIADVLPQSTREAEFYDFGATEPYMLDGDAIKQRRQLVEVIRDKEKDSDYRTAYQYVMEEVAYTWFNRLIAVRFMEVNDYLPTGLRVLSSESGKLEPDLVTHLDEAEFEFNEAEKKEIAEWQLNNELDKLFCLLFIKQCNELNKILPGLFEKTKDYTELLLNLSVVDHEGVVYKLTHDIEEKFFNVDDEPKKAAFEKSGKITKEEIPAVTQLFTPDWIVRYMVENSLGRLWLEGHPDSDLRQNWKYYLDEAPQEPEVQAKLADIRKEYATLNPEDLTLIDPCMGSGHILVYAFDVLMQIYTSVGYSERDAAKSILEHNLYGLDIDDRAYQLAYFAVMMKARQYNRRILNGENTCHVYAIQESNPINRAHLKFFGAGLSDLEKNTAKMQLEGLLDILTDAKEYGSILNVPEYNWALLRRFVDGIDDEVQISLESAGVEQTAEELQKLIDLGETMARKYWVTCTNPPYMGNMPPKMTCYVQKQYAVEKYDLYAVFVKKCRTLSYKNGFVSMITQQAWMFLSSFENFRINLNTACVINLVQLGSRAFDEIGGEVVQTVTFVLRTVCLDSYEAIYIDLTQASAPKEKEKQFFEKEKIYCKQSNFEKIPGNVYAYRMPEKARELFAGKTLSNYSIIKSGIVTGNNDYFLKTWFEISLAVISFLHKSFVDNSNIQWVPMHKGGGYRKHYGFHDYVMNLHDIWEPSKTKSNVRRGDPEFYFKEGLTWSTLANDLSVRRSPTGFVFDTKGSMCFARNAKDLPYFEALLNSKIAAYYMTFLSPTLDFNQGAMGKLPVVLCDEECRKKIEILSESNVNASKADWDSFETSWDFKTHPLVRCKSFPPKEVAEDAKHHIVDMNMIQEAFTNWSNECYLRFEKLKANEEELNRIFIDIFGLQDELTPEVEDKDVTVRKADLQRDIKSLLSYAVGCMFGRYSIYKDGLLFAGEPYSLQAFVDKLNDRPGTVSAEELERAYRNEGVVVDEMFFPDKDNVIPITDEEYLDDDIVARLCDWLKAVYGAATLEENLNFIAKALGNKGSTSREVIRNYFLNDFFKDHCQTYSVTGSGKRPIYWLFDSGKQNGFKALVYLHRYTPDTIGTLRVDYLHKMQRVYESEKARMQDMMDHTNNTREKAAAEKRRNKLQLQIDECQKYDEKISHLALARIELDLDDGVKVNYRKLQTDTEGKFREVLADSKNIMAKEKK